MASSTSTFHNSTPSNTPPSGQGEPISTTSSRPQQDVATNTKQITSQIRSFLESLPKAPNPGQRSSISIRIAYGNDTLNINSPFQTEFSGNDLLDLDFSSSLTSKLIPTSGVPAFPSCVGDRASSESVEFDESKALFSPGSDRADTSHSLEDKSPRNQQTGKGIDLPDSAGASLTLQKRVRDVELPAMKLDLSDETSAFELMNAREAFFKDLSEVIVPVTASKRPQIGKTSAEEETREITIFFFDNMMQFPGLRRLNEIINGHNVSSIDGLTTEAIRAERLAADQDKIDPVRKFFKYYAKAQRNELTMRRVSASSSHIVRSRIPLWRAQHRLRQMAERGDEALIQTLIKKGYRARGGQDLVSLTTDYLCDELRISRDNRGALHKACQQAQSVDIMCRTFGEGILLILPGDVMRTLDRWGNQQMNEVSHLLEKHADFMRPIGDLLTHHIWKPIEQGETLSIPLLNVDEKDSMSFFGRIEAAIHQGGLVGRQMRKRRFVVGESDEE